MKEGKKRMKEREKRMEKKGWKEYREKIFLLIKKRKRERK